jgi:hypothetical protein
VPNPRSLIEGVLIMNSVTDVMPMAPTVSKGAILSKLFVIGYLTVIVVATIGWVSAFGWITFRVTKWLLT